MESTQEVIFQIGDEVTRSDRKHGSVGKIIEIVDHSLFPIGVHWRRGGVSWERPNNLKTIEGAS